MSGLLTRLGLRKSIADIQAEAAASPLRRTLGPLNLVSLGIGAIVGAGIFVVTGEVASTYAGPGIIFSFLLASIVCALAGLCYAELASTMPVSGSAYTYAYGTLGEVFAWVMGWLLLLEYGVAAASVAVGWSGYVVSILGDFGIHFPQITVAGEAAPAYATPLIQAMPVTTVNAAGETIERTAFALTGTFNLVAAIGIAFVSALLVLGISESARANNLIVAIKISVLLIFIAVGIAYIDPANWSPLIPPQGDSWDKFGWGGIVRGAAIIFFAYIGFEAVSTAAAESRKPARDVPIGILGSLFVCTLLYIAVAMVMTGVVPYPELASPAPIAVAIDRMELEWANVGQINLIALLIKIGAVTGLGSVMLVVCYAQTRVAYTIAGDGLLPGIFARVHPKRRTPWLGTIIMGIVTAVAAAFLPIRILGDLVSLGTTLAFAMVCLSVIWLRVKHPEMPRPFRAPGGIYTAAAGMIACLALAGFNLMPSVMHALQGNPLPLTILVSYAALGAALYAGYGYWNSRLAKTQGSQTPAPR